MCSHAVTHTGRLIHNADIFAIQLEHISVITLIFILLLARMSDNIPFPFLFHGAHQSTDRSDIVISAFSHIICNQNLSFFQTESTLTKTLTWNVPTSARITLLNREVSILLGDVSSPARVSGCDGVIGSTGNIMWHAEQQCHSSPNANYQMAMNQWVNGTMDSI